jgi:creatinine amidohydrolase
MEQAWGERTYREIAGRSRERLVAILPLGAVEAHGPHLPLTTDGIIAQAMAEEGARRLEGRGLQALVLPPLEYSAAPFAGEFSGTVSVRPETAAAMVRDIGWALAPRITCFALANAHLDPAHLGSLHSAAEELKELGVLVAFPDLTLKPWALRLGDEFRSGACHAGCYETSVVMAARPELVRGAIRRTLAPNPRSLSQAIRDGKKTFQEAGGPDAYFGAPAEATAGEGRDTISELGAILEAAVFQALSEGSAS